MGYTRRYLSITVLKQALLLAIGGFIPGVIISDVLYHITASQAHVPIEMTPMIAGSVLVLGIIMCSVSGLLSLRKLDAADPADLFA
jgi:putative ABC transport system permease protein